MTETTLKSEKEKQQRYTRSGTLVKKKNKKKYQFLISSPIEPQPLDSHYTSSQNPPLVNHHYHDRGHNMFYPSSLLFLPLDVLERECVVYWYSI